MKLMTLILMLYLSLHANSKNEIVSLFKAKQYKEACLQGLSIIDKYSRDENFMTLYAFSCLNSDYIDRLNLPIAKLKFSKEARSNAAYFSVILMQKKLLLHSMVDGYDISSLKLPSTDFILSKVFDFYVHAPMGKASYSFSDPDKKNVSYKLYLKKERGVHKIVIEEYYDKIMSRRHYYW